MENELFNGSGTVCVCVWARSAGAFKTKQINNNFFSIGNLQFVIVPLVVVVVVSYTYRAQHMVCYHVVFGSRAATGQRVENVWYVPLLDWDTYVPFVSKYRTTNEKYKSRKVCTKQHCKFSDRFVGLCAASSRVEPRVAVQ